MAILITIKRKISSGKFKFYLYIFEISVKHLKYLLGTVSFTQIISHRAE